MWHITMIDEVTREDESGEDLTEGVNPEVMAEADSSVEHDPLNEVTPEVEPVQVEEDTTSVLKKSLGLGLPSDRYRVVIPKGSFPPVNGRQQFIARLRDKDRVSFRIYEGDEDIASRNEFLGELGMVGIALNKEDKAFIEVDFNLNIDLNLTIRLLDRYGERESYMALDLSRSPRTVIRQDTVIELIARMESLEKRIVELGKGGG